MMGFRLWWSTVRWRAGYPRFKVPARCHTCGTTSTNERDHLTHLCREPDKASGYRETIEQREATIAYLMAHGGDDNFTYGGGVLMAKSRRWRAVDFPAQVIDVTQEVGFQCMHNPGFDTLLERLEIECEENADLARFRHCLSWNYAIDAVREAMKGETGVD